MSALYHLYMNSSIIFACSLISRANRLRRRQDERASPVADEFVCPCLYRQTRGRKHSLLSPSHSMFFYICSYRFIPPQEIRAPFGHQSVKNHCCFKCCNRRKSPHLQGFSQFKPVLENKIKYYFFI